MIDNFICKQRLIELTVSTCQAKRLIWSKTRVL